MFLLLSCINNIIIITIIIINNYNIMYKTC